ncbi:hypothetical protein [Flectobacillus longus]|uniref:hypothetical protein n=1 Tax=Flectobacillus longus TaxID=2984207 RepID=UPI0024B7338B|nr:hypothetical protein [Flectobacillus longus]MDI9880721.1 hypothetical protein [Flectobacillus longus]
MMNTLPSKKHFAKIFLLVFHISVFGNYTVVYASEEAPPILAIEKYMDNPKKKLRIKLVFNEEEKDSTTQKKSVFAKVKGLVNAILNFSDNPPVRLKVGYEADKAKKQ